MLHYPLAGRTKAGDDRDISHDCRRAFGGYVRDHRLRADMTQQQLADRMKLWFTTVSAWETGRSSIDPAHYEDLANIFGVPQEEFGKVALRYTNPWIYAMLYGEQANGVKTDLEALHSRNVEVQSKSTRGVPRMRKRTGT